MASSRPTRTRAGLALALSIALVGCGRDREPARDNTHRSPPPATVDGLAALPPGARVVLGINVPQLRQQAVGTLLWERLSARLAPGPKGADSLSAWLNSCGTPAENLDAVALALGDLSKPDELLLVVVGPLDPARLTACLKAAVAPTGQVTQIDVQGAPAQHVVHGGRELWLAFGSPRTLLVAGSPAWLARAREPRQADPLKWLAPARLGAAAWAVVGDVPQVLPELAPALGKPPTAAPRRVLGSLDFQEGLELRVDFELETPSDATDLASFLKARRPALVALAQTVGAGRFVQDIAVTTEQSSTRTLLQLRGKNVGHLEEWLGKPKTEPMVPPKGAPQ